MVRSPQQDVAEYGERLKHLDLTPNVVLRSMCLTLIEAKPDLAPPSKQSPGLEDPGGSIWLVG